MAKEFLGRGWTFPVSIDNRGGVSFSRYEEKIRQSILLILETAKGERVMRPHFGCGIHEYVFAVVNSAVLTLVGNSIKEALLKWEPRVEVLSVKPATDRLNVGILDISIDYRVRKTNNRANLVYPFYIKYQ